MRSQTRIDVVMDEIKLKISSRTYLPSHRLPSVRQQARTWPKASFCLNLDQAFMCLALSRHWLWPK